MTRPRKDWIWLVIASAPVYLFRVKRDAGRTFHPATITVGYQLDQFDMVLTDRGDMPVVLAHVFVGMDAVDHATRILDQHLHAASDADRTHHPEAVQREHLQWLLGTIGIRTRAARGSVGLQFGRARAER